MKQQALENLLSQIRKMCDEYRTFNNTFVETVSNMIDKSALLRHEYKLYKVELLGSDSIKAFYWNDDKTIILTETYHHSLQSTIPIKFIR